ncbi:hypothetical protein [Sutterella wadsworthensis]|uniref:hypothetical protein n=1 Tax=Sutterella wadsworthensis TaxID=40545 RepID=UPI0032C13E05
MNKIKNKLKEKINITEKRLDYISNIQKQLESNNIKFDEIVFDRDSVSFRLRKNLDTIFYLTFFENDFLVEYKKGKNELFYSYSYTYDNEIPRIIQLYTFYCV